MLARAALLAATLLASGLGASAQLKSGDTAPVFLGGGYGARACSYPKSARDAGLSGCCAMKLEIDTEGRVKSASGQCTDKVFLEPTRRCLSIQQFMPATHSGQPIAATHTMEYEWRSNGGGSQCRKLQTS